MITVDRLKGLMMIVWFFGSVILIDQRNDVLYSIGLFLFGGFTGWMVGYIAGFNKW